VKLSEIASKLEISLAQLSLAWIHRREEITSTIIGASRPSQIEENVKAAELTLEPAILEEIENILDNKPEIPYPYNHDPYD